MRLLILLLIGYLTYKFVISPFFEGLKAPEKKDEIPTGTKSDTHEDDYIDYEEVD